jgi:transcriptional regulator with XRE-family HTH domain
MATRKTKRPEKKSDAIRFLESITGGPLTLGRALESFRKCDDASLEQYAKRLGISRSNLCDIEKGRKLVSPERAAKFAKILGHSVNVFVSLALQASVDSAGLKLKVNVEAA